MPSTMSRMQYADGRPPLPASQAGCGSSGSQTAHSRSSMSEGYRRERVLRLCPPGQHRHAAAGGRPAAAEWTAAGGTRYNGTQGSWDRAGFDTHAITRGLCCHSEATPYGRPEDHETLRLRPMPSFQAGSEEYLKQTIFNRKCDR